MKSSTTKDLESVVKKIKALEDHIKDLEVERNLLEINRIHLAQKYIQENKLLSECDWIISIKHDYTIRILTTYKFVPQKIIDLLRPGWHAKYDLEDGVSLLFNDDEVELIFDKDITNAFIITFIKNNNLKLNTTELVKRLDKQRNSLELADAILGNLNDTQCKTK